MPNLCTYTERTWLEQGCTVGEHVIPLARNFNDVSLDLESDGRIKVCDLCSKVNFHRFLC